MILITAPVGVEAASHVFASLAIGAAPLVTHWHGRGNDDAAGRPHQSEVAYLLHDGCRGMSVFAACRSLLPFAFDMVTQDLLSDVHDANEGHPFKNIAVAMI